MIIVQDFETVTFCVICIQTDLLCCLLLNEKVACFNSLFIPYISTAKPFSLVKGYIGVKINKHEIWLADGHLNV